jgi:hypothetical protein
MKIIIPSIYRQFGRPRGQLNSPRGRPLTETGVTYNRQFRDLSHGRAVRIAQLLLIFSYIRDLSHGPRRVFWSFRRAHE